MTVSCKGPIFITGGGEDGGNCSLKKSSEHILSCPDKKYNIIV